MSETREAGRERDAEVAERVMGWERWTCDDYLGAQSVLMKPGTSLGHSWRRADVPLEPNGGALVPWYTTDVAADYSVLEHVRMTWLDTELRRMEAHLCALWQQESDMASLGLYVLNYRVGDYSRAALAALEDR